MNGRVHNKLTFNVSRGTIKTSYSLLSPFLFNMYLSDLLYELDGVNQRLRVGTHLYNPFVYTDDVAIFRSAVPGFQQLIIIRVENIP